MEPGKVVDYAIGTAGMTAPWWIQVLHGMTDVGTTVAAMGGAVLVCIRIVQALRGK